jgi:hypothetical protein
MTDEELNEIMGRMMHPKERRDITLAQSDRARLLAEVERLRKRLSCLSDKASGDGSRAT